MEGLLVLNCALIVLCRQGDLHSCDPIIVLTNALWMVPFPTLCTPLSLDWSSEPYPKLQSLLFQGTHKGSTYRAVIFAIAQLSCFYFLVKFYTDYV